MVRNADTFVERHIKGLPGAVQRRILTYCSIHDLLRGGRKKGESPYEERSPQIYRVNGEHERGKYMGGPATSGEH